MHSLLPRWVNRAILPHFSRVRLSTDRDENNDRKDFRVRLLAMKKRRGPRHVGFAAKSDRRRGCYYDAARPACSTTLPSARISEFTKARSAGTGGVSIGGDAGTNAVIVSLPALSRYCARFLLLPNPGAYCL
jgi:hypothetical protein